MIVGTVFFCRRRVSLDARDPKLKGHVATKGFYSAAARSQTAFRAFTMSMYRVILSVFLLLPSLNLAQENGAVRLVGGESENEGRLEVYYDGRWGTICDDSFNWQDAHVLCKQMGFERALRLYYRGVLVGAMTINLFGSTRSLVLTMLLPC